MKAVVLAVVGLSLLVSVFAVNTQQAREEFLKFQKKFNKVYTTQEEFNRRFQIFQENLRIAEEKTRKNPIHKAGVTKFSDLTKDEFKSMYLLQKSPFTVKKDPKKLTNQTRLHNVKVPTTFDWRDKGAVTAVYNQGQCGSCWAFSVTENIESVWFLAGHPLTGLSMQQVVDCDTSDSGCNGGDPPTAYQYVMSQGGMDTLSSYPYVGQDQQCAYNPNNVDAKISNWEYVTQSSDENAMQQFLVSTAPESICVDAETWSDYTGGIVTSSSGCGDSLDHCVLLVGYGVDSQAGTYWIVRNSWGTDWGINGYIYIQKGNDVCGIADEVTCATV